MERSARFAALALSPPLFRLRARSRPRGIRAPGAVVDAGERRDAWRRMASVSALPAHRELVEGARFLLPRGRICGRAGAEHLRTDALPLFQPRTRCTRQSPFEEHPRADL